MVGPLTAIYIMVRTSYIHWDDDDVRFVLNQHADLDFYNGNSPKQQSNSRHVASLGHIIGVVVAVIVFTTTFAISAYHHRLLWVRISIRARHTTLCDKVCQWLATGQWFSPGPPVSSTNKTDRHDITEILLKVALNTIKQTNSLHSIYFIVTLLR